MKLTYIWRENCGENFLFGENEIFYGIRGALELLWALVREIIAVERGEGAQFE